MTKDFYSIIRNELKKETGKYPRYFTRAFYKDYFLRYISANATVREESRQHWLKCHAKNVLSGREDLIIFSAKILAAISLADDMLEKLSV